MITQLGGSVPIVLPIRAPRRLRTAIIAAMTAFAAIVMISALAVPGAWAQGSGTKLMADGQKSLEAGDYDAAIDQLSKAIKSGSLGKPEMARAFVYRGQALQGKGSQARAVADFTNALWLESLSGADTARALALRGTSRQQLGQTKAAAEDFKKANAAQPGISQKVAGKAGAPSGTPAAAQRRSGGEEGGFFSNLFGGSTNQSATPRTASGTVVKTKAGGGNPAGRRKVSENSASGSVFGNLFGGSDDPKPEATSGPRQLGPGSQTAGTRTRLVPTTSSTPNAEKIDRPGVLTDILPGGDSEPAPQRKPGTSAPEVPITVAQRPRNVDPPKEEPGFFARIFSRNSPQPPVQSTAKTRSAKTSGPRRLVTRSDGPPAPAPVNSTVASGPRTQRDTSLPTFVNQPRLTDRILANDAVEPGGTTGSPTQIASLKPQTAGLQSGRRRVDAPIVAVEPAQLDWNQTTRVERGRLNAPIAAARPRPAPVAARRPIQVASRTPVKVKPAPPSRQRVTATAQSGRGKLKPAAPRTTQPRQSTSTLGQTVRSAVKWVDGVISGYPAEEEAPAARQRKVASAPVRQRASTTYRAPKKPAPHRQAATAGGGYVIQLAARQRRSDAEAAARAVSSRHSAILGGAKPYIVRADIAGKGTYYRVRVGPYRTKAQVSSICAQLKGRGQDCFATR